MLDFTQTIDKTQNSIILTPSLIEVFSKNVYNPVTFVDTLFKEVINLSASDLLFESNTDTVRVRVRIDGLLYNLGYVSITQFLPISARIKILAKLDSTGKKYIQEGQITIEHEERTVNLRLEIVQTIHGEMIVLRIHEKKNIIMDLNQLGFNPNSLQTYQQILNSQNGLILVSGSTGCGKTTTLYSTLNFINKKQNLNIMTIEDPIEYQMQGINQLQVQNELGFTFAEGLRTIVRLSPNIIFVGEIRDRETAEIAIESSLTGHLVFSTIHANDTVGTLFRLLDLHIEKYLLNASLVGIIGQRLVHINCPDCKENIIPTKEEIDLFMQVLGRPPAKLMKSKGCSKCNNLTYKGRIGIFEVLTFNSSIRKFIREGTSEDEIRLELKKQNFVNLFEDGLLKCEQGITTVSEVIKNNVKQI
jgi:type IV pilus assembly protein PilB